MAEEMVEGPGGTQATHSATGGEPAGRLQARASHAVEVSRDYLREHDFEDMRSDLEREIRAHPIKSIAIALGAGYVLGKLFK